MGRCSPAGLRPPSAQRPTLVSYTTPGDANVSIFRAQVIEAYERRCALSGLPEPRLIDAAHIVPDSDERLGQPDIRNGICMSKVHHAAYDAGLIGIDPDLMIHVSERRGVTETIKRELKRRAAVEPVIGHMKNEHRMDRNYLRHSTGDANNAVLAAVGYNFARLLAWLRELLCALLRFWMLLRAPPPTRRRHPPKPPDALLHGRRGQEAAMRRAWRDASSRGSGQVHYRGLSERLWRARASV